MPRKTKKNRRKPVKANGAAMPVETANAAKTVVSTDAPVEKPAQLVPPAPATIDYDAAVNEGKEIVAGLAAAQDRRMRLGELADAVEKVYGQARLTKYAKDIGMAACTLARSRSVWRAWAEAKEAAPPKSFAVAQELQAHPRRFEIIKAEPDITTRKARAKMRELKREQVAANPDWRRDEQRRWFRAVVKHAEEVIRDAGLADSEEVDPKLKQALREAVEPDLLPTLREAAEGLTRLADYLERLTTAPERRPRKRADAAQAPAQEAVRP